MFELKKIEFYYSAKLKMWMAMTKPPCWKRSLSATGLSKQLAIAKLKARAGEYEIVCPRAVAIKELPKDRQAELERLLQSRQRQLENVKG